MTCLNNCKQWHCPSVTLLCIIPCLCTSLHLFVFWPTLNGQVMSWFQCIKMVYCRCWCVWVPPKNHFTDSTKQDSIKRWLAVSITFCRNDHSLGFAVQIKILNKAAQKWGEEVMKCKATQGESIHAIQLCQWSNAGPLPHSCTYEYDYIYLWLFFLIIFTWNGGTK